MNGKIHLVRLALAAIGAAILTLALVAATSATLAQQQFPARPAAPNPTDWTITPITSNTTWTLANSPYLVNVALMINNGVTLTIEPGVVVKFYASRSLSAVGKLNAVGTAQAPIIFTSINDRSDGSSTGTGIPNPGDWFGVNLNNPSSRLEHVELRYGGGQVGVAAATLLIDGQGAPISSPTLTEISIQQGKGSGIYCSSATVMLSNVTVSGTVVGSSWLIAYQGNGIYATNSAIPQVRNSVFHGNAGWGAYLAGSAAATITQSTLQNNVKGGVYVTGGTANVLSNTIRASAAGVSVTAGTAVVHYNTIRDHTAYGVWNGGAACLDARWNYWGAASGPRDNDAGTTSDSCGPAGGIAGAGDKVSKKVNASEWLTSLPVNHFGFDFIPTQAVNVPFAIRVRALDAENNLVTTYNGAVTLSDATLTIVPTTTLLVNGVATPTVTIAQPAVGTQITARAGDLTGVSNPFNVAAISWEQANPGGFGHADSIDVKALVEFNGNLYAALHNLTTGGQLWRSADGASWTNVGPGAQGGGDWALISLAVFQSRIYTTTANGRIYASATGNPGEWTRITDDGFGNSYNKEARLAVFKGRLYAAFTNSQNGIQIWRSKPDGAWERVVQGGFSLVNSRLVTALAPYGDHLYVAARDTTTWEAKLWRTATGDLYDSTSAHPAWTQVKSWPNTAVEALAPFGGAFYAGASYQPVSGAVSQIWQSVDGATWAAAATNGFGDVNNWAAPALATYARRLFVGTTNPTTGVEVWLGNAWYQANLDGFDDAATTRAGALGPFRGRLYAGVGGAAAQIWRTIPNLETQAGASPASASFIGEAASDMSGYALAGAGDVDGDGYRDFLIGAPDNDAGGSDAGRVYLFFGKAGGWTMDKRLAEADVIFQGLGADHITGAALAGLGDVNGDGLADFAIGAPGANQSQGGVYLIFGRARASWPGQFDLANASASYVGEAAGDQAGKALAAAGDVNRDGYRDLLIVAPNADGAQANIGNAYLIFGQAGGWGQNVSLGTAGASFTGEANGFGVDHAAGSGDVNGDGYADLLIGASGNSEGGANAGQTYLILGRQAGGFSANMALPGPAAASFWGEGAGDRAGRALAGAGDVNRDGFADFLIGAMNRTYLILGGASWVLDTRLSAAPASFEVGADSLALVGDANGDGYDDFLIGDGSYAAYLFFGRRAADWGARYRRELADAAYVTESGADLVGSAVAGAGDANGDGLADLLIGARGNDEGGSNAGESYLVLGESAGIGLAKLAPPLAASGAAITYVVRLTNFTGAAVSLTLTDALPSGVAYVDGSAQGWSGGLQQGNLTWRGILGPNETKRFTFTVSLPAGLTDGTRILNTVTLDDLIHGPRTINAATVVTSAAQLPDLEVLPDSVFVGPPVIHQGSTHLVGARFRNNSSLELRNVRVAFFAGEPGPTTRIGAVITIPTFAPNSVVVTRTGLVWNTASVATGTHPVNALVDIGNAIAESNETNNRSTKLVTVYPPVADNAIPTGAISVTGGAQVTLVRGITLTLNATDTGGSGLQQMRVAEFMFDSAAGSWRLAQDGGWVNYTTTLSWTLSEGNGVKYLLAWFKDGAGNVSWPAARTYINYIASGGASAAAVASETIWQWEWHVYRLRLVANRVITLTLNNVTGDPDLYLWQPDNDGWPAAYGVNVGADQITFHAPAADIYQFAVYGAQAGTYDLGMAFGWGASASAQAAPFDLAAKIVMGKSPV